MTRNLLTIFAVAFTAAGLTTNATSANTTLTLDVSSPWYGYMNVFNNASGSKGSYVFGSGWGVNDLKSTINPSAGTLTLQPNFNTYLNSLTGNDADRAFWTDSTDGGVTAGANGGKWMDASTYMESSDGTLLTNLTFIGAISSFSLSSSYNATAFIKALDPALGYATVISQTTPLASTGAFSVSADLSGGVGKNWLVQYGFSVGGLNANPANEVALGSIVAQSVPEPSTYAILAGLGAQLLRRRRR